MLTFVFFNYYYFNTYPSRKPIISLITQHSVFPWQEYYQNTRGAVICGHDSVLEELMLKSHIRFFYLRLYGSPSEEMCLDVIF